MNENTDTWDAPAATDAPGEEGKPQPSPARPPFALWAAPLLPLDMVSEDGRIIDPQATFVVREGAPLLQLDESEQGQIGIHHPVGLLLHVRVADGMVWGTGVTDDRELAGDLRAGRLWLGAELQVGDTHFCRSCAQMELMGQITVMGANVRPADQTPWPAWNPLCVPEAILKAQSAVGGV